MKIDNYEKQWMADRGIKLEEELVKTNCFRTKEPYNGVLSEITIACIDKEGRDFVIWWYQNPYNYKYLTKESD